MAKRLNILFFLFIVLSLCPRLAGASDTVVVHTMDDIDSIPIIGNASIWIDETGSADWHEAMQKPFYYTPDIPGYFDSVYGRRKVTMWLRLTVQNEIPEEYEMVLLFFRYAYYKEVIVIKNNDTIIQRPNYYFTAVAKEDRKNINLDARQGETVTFLIRMYNPYANLYDIDFLVTNYESYRRARMMMYHRSYPAYIFQIQFLAIVLFITLHTLVQYFIRRRKEFIFYALYSFCVFIFFLYRLEHSIYYDIVFSYMPFVYKYCNNILSILVYYTYFRFARQFVDFKSLWPWFYHVIRWIERVLLAAIVFDIACSTIFNNIELREWAFLVLRVGLLLVSFIGIFLLLSSRKRVLYFFGIGSLLLIIGSLLAMVYTFYPEANPVSTDSIRYMQYGIVLELLCFTSGLSYKTHLIEGEKRATQEQLITQLEENRRLQEELNINLEARVKEQTEQILLQQQELEKEREQQLTLEFTRKITEMELQLLKSQLNPHFYFNTLNNLYGLAMIAPKKAPDAILKLSDIMEYVIYECRNDKVPLDTELKFLQSYIELEKLRYEDDAGITLSVTGKMNGQSISPMLLIQFVENGFKHGMEQQKGHSFLRINIILQENRLLYESSNSLNGHNTKEGSGGVGLSNVKKRLEILYPGRHNLQILADETEFKVMLELIL